MRIVKMSKEEPDLENIAKVRHFFDSEIGQRSPKGQFFIKKGSIAKGSLSVGERLIFSYDRKIVYSGISTTGRINSSSPWEKSKGPYFFAVDLSSLQRYENVTYSQFSGRYFHLTGNELLGRGWRIIDEPHSTALWNWIKAQG